MPIMWPTTLPLPSIEGYGLHPGEAMLRTEMEAGPARQRRRYTQVPSRISVRWVMRADQFALFESWYRWHAKEGAEWFAMDLLGGMGILPHEVRFVRSFNAVPKRGTLWTITTELETRQRPIMDEGVLAIALDSDANALILTTNTLHTFVHTTLPGPHVW